MEGCLPLTLQVRLCALHPPPLEMSLCAFWERRLFSGHASERYAQPAEQVTVNVACGALGEDD